MKTNSSLGKCNAQHHLSRRSMLKGTVVTAGGMAVGN